MKEEGVRGKWFPVGGAGGFSITELVVALGIAVVAAAGIYGVYVSQTRESSSQRLHNDLQNNLRFAMDVMKSELFLAGFNAIDTDQPIIEAEPDTITFEYWDDNLATAAPYTQNVKVTYSLSGSDLVRSRVKYHGTTGWDPSTQEDQVLAEYVSDLTFSYRQNNNAPFTDDSLGTAAELERVRIIKLSLTGQSRKEDPLLKDRSDPSKRLRRELTLTGEVKSRNLDIAANPFDKDPPKTPTGLHVWDPGICGRLEMTWDANDDADLSGYTIVYGLAPGSYTGRVEVSRGAGVGGDYTLTGLETTYEPYYVTIRAYDRSANVSPYAVPVHNDPQPDSVRERTGANDTSVTPEVPPPPTNLAATYPEDGQVLLTWTASPDPGVIGYRILRGKYDPTEAYIESEVAIAEENVLDDRAKTEHLDDGSVGGALVGCWKYRYRIVSIHCDPAIFPASYDEHPDTSYTVLDDVRPTDGTDPSPPDIAARAGYGRFFLTLTNPLRDDEPDFSHTEIHYNKGPEGSSNFPSVDTGGNLDETTGFVLPEGTPYGTFPLEGRTVIDFNDDQNNPPHPSAPNLQIDQTYFFLAVAFDTCGNHSGNTAQASGTQCGDGEGTAYDGPPIAPDPNSFDSEGCGYHIGIAWEDLWTTQDQESILDFAGYHVFRREVLPGGGVTDWVDQNDTGPAWEPSLLDSRESEFPIEIGKAYQYKVCATDCYYERGRLSPETIGDGPPWEDNLSCVEVKNLRDFYIGEFGLSDQQKILRTGDIEIYPTTPSLPEDPDPPTAGDISISSTFQHNTAAAALDNRAAGTLTETSITMSWADPLETFLTAIEIGGGSSTTSQEFVFYQTGLPVSSNSTATYNPPKTIDPGDLTVPHRFLFTGLDGDAYAPILPDLREGILDVRDLAWTNDSTGDNTCTQGERLWAPLGPVVTSVVQDRPGDPTVSWPVPGEDGNNLMDRVVVPGDAEVHVRANVIPDLFTQGLVPYDTGNPTASPVRLFYYNDVGAVLPNPPASYEFTNSIPMFQEAGNQWKTLEAIPASNGSNIWYYIVAVDVNGNFDREPETYAGAFQYYQQEGDVCSNTPGPPTGLIGEAASSSVTLTWEAPLFNDEETNPTTFTDPGGYNIWRNADQGWERIPPASGSSDEPTVDAFTRTFYDTIEPPGDLSTENYQYYVTAIDTCRPEYNESVPSSSFSECIGADSCVFTVIPSGGSIVVPGDEFRLELQICEKKGNELPNEELFVQVCTAVGGGSIGADADSIRLIEDGDSGNFTINASHPPYSNRDYIKTYDDVNVAYPDPASDLDLIVSPAGDTITIGAYSDVEYSGSTCDSSFTCGEEQFAVSSDPCVNDPVAPGAPTGLVVETPDCSTASKPASVVLSWDAHEPGDTVTIYRVESCKVQGGNCTWGTETTTTDNTASFSTDSRMDNSTWRFQVIAINDPQDICPDLPTVETDSDPVTETCN